MRARPLLAVTCLAAALVVEGCGGDGDPQASKGLAGVVLEVSLPQDMAVVEAETIEVRGTVAPARADVRVLGRRATVSDGTFSTAVPLEPGANVIDVIATAAGRDPVLTAFRVTRQVPVTVPDLAGADVEDAESQLSDLGLKVEVEDADGFLEEFLPEEPTVCAQDPEPGAKVRRGTTVQLMVSKRC